MATPEFVFPEGEIYRSLQYDGNNSSQLNAEIADFTITSEAAGVLSFTSNAVAYNVSTDGYVVYLNGVVTDVFLNDDDLNDNYGALTATAVEHYHTLELHTSVGIPGAPEA